MDPDIQFLLALIVHTIHPDRHKKTMCRKLRHIVIYLGIISC